MSSRRSRSGPHHSCGLSADNTISCWGDNEFDRTGLLSQQFSAVAVSASGSCALHTDGAIFCWGAGERYKLEPPGKFTSVVVGDTHSCALGAEGNIACWGRGPATASADATSSTETSLDNPADSPPGQFTDVVIGSSHSCGLRVDRTVTCWGYNGDGQTDAPGGQFTAIDASSDNSCGLRVDGTINCWGSIARFDTPEGRFVDMSVARSHACALGTDTTVTCWGDNDRGQTDAPPGEFTTVTVAGGRSCGLRADGTIGLLGLRGAATAAPGSATPRPPSRRSATITDRRNEPPPVLGQRVRG